jgi:hypothetical protein
VPASNAATIDCDPVPEYAVKDKSSAIQCIDHVLSYNLLFVDVLILYLKPVYDLIQLLICIIVGNRT